MKSLLLGTLTIFGLLSFFTVCTIQFLRDADAWVK